MARKKVHVEMEGVEELRRAIARLDVNALNGARGAIKESAEDMLGEAQARVPIGETHNLYDSLKIIYLDAGLLASVGTAYFVAKFHEFGTRYMPASPFVTPAWEITRPKFLVALTRAMGKAGADAAAGRVGAAVGPKGGSIGIPTMPATRAPTPGVNGA